MTRLFTRFKWNGNCRILDLDRCQSTPHCIRVYIAPRAAIRSVHCWLIRMQRTYRLVSD